MKKIPVLVLALLMLIITISSCSNDPQKKAENAIKSHLKSNLKKPDTYEPISFSAHDTLWEGPELKDNQFKELVVTHVYRITNKAGQKIPMTIQVLLNKDLEVIKIRSGSINGDYGSLSGNVYWKFNDFIGNKADSGAEIEMMAIDSMRSEFRFQTKADFQGNFKIDKVPPGKYLLMVRSNNVNACPDKHLRNLLFYADCFNKIYGFDIHRYEAELQEIDKIDQLARTVLYDQKASKGSTSETLKSYKKLKSQSSELANKLISSLPTEFLGRIKLYTGYSNAFDVSTIEIEEGQEKQEVIDFGVTCI